MPILVVAVLVVGALCVLDLLLTFGVIRRLREHTGQLEKLLQGVPDGTAAVGTTVGPFAATTVDGEPVSRESLTGDTLVAFFTPTCEPCREKLPGFVEYARSLADRDKVIAVVAGRADEAQDAVDALTPVARVLLQDDGDVVASAFGITAFPSFVLVDQTGTVRAAELDYARLPVPAGT